MAMRFVEKILLPTPKHNPRIKVLEVICPPKVIILWAKLVWEPFQPILPINFSLMKLWVAPESNKILTGVSL
jgi:hypothetical protein